MGESTPRNNSLLVGIACEHLDICHSHVRLGLTCTIDPNVSKASTFLQPDERSIAARVSLTHQSSTAGRDDLREPPVGVEGKIRRRCTQRHAPRNDETLVPVLLASEVDHLGLFEDDLGPSRRRGELGVELAKGA